MGDWTTDTFQVELPEIYQLEISSRCNLSCPACIRTDPRVARPIGDMSPELVQTMLDRGDFDGSYFVELQLYGEPTLHPQFNDIVGLLKGQNFKIGMSTNGILLDTKKFDIYSLDYLTISIDSPDKKTYEKLRPGAFFDRLVQNIDTILMAGSKPKVDLQVIKFWDKPSELPGLIQLAEKMHWQNAICREVPDCFAAYQGRPYPEDRKHQLCLNPWLSVSVQWDGDCCPCCFSAGKDIVYGNLWQSSLKDIWQNSLVRKGLMDRMVHDFNQNGMPCKLCYMKSPTLLHMAMLRYDLGTS